MSQRSTFLTNLVVRVILIELLTSFSCHASVTSGPIMSASLLPSSSSQQTSQLLVQMGQDFSRTCTVPMGRGLNITCTLPSSGSSTASETTTQRHNEASLYLRKLSNLKDRLTMTYHSDPIRQEITSTMIIRNASYLDTGYYGCRLNNSNTKFNETYIFVHPLHVASLETSSSEPADVIDDNDLLLPTLDVYVLEENKAVDQFIPFKPTHPEVKLYLSKKIKNHWIEIFSSEYSVINGNGNWFWDKYRGLIISQVNANQTTGVYWCDAILDGKTTTRYFRIFVTSDEEDDDRPHNNLVPRIKNAVEYLIFPSGSSFQLKCQIAIDESRNYNLTWSVPSKPTKHLNYSITWETVGNLRSAILKASDIRFLDTGNYTCQRSDALHLVASQYIFVSDGDHLFLPTERSYVFNDTQNAVLPCRPTHPDVVVSLQIEGKTSRGIENITLYPMADDRGRSGDWLYSKFQGFRTKMNATRANAGRKYLCKGTRFGQTNHLFIDVTVADIRLTVSDLGAITEGDDATIKCETYYGHSVITWHPPSGPSVTIEAGSLQNPAGISRVTQTPNKETRKPQDLYMTEVRWRNISKSATGLYECRYRDNLRHSVAVRYYSMEVRAAMVPRLEKQLGGKKKYITVKIQERENTQFECHLLEGVPTPTVSWLKDGVIVNKDRLIKDLIINETTINGTLHSYLHLVDVEAASEGEYTCLFENRLGSDNKTFRLEVALDDDYYTATITITVVLIVIAAVLLLAARIFYVRLTKARNATDIAKMLEPLLAGNPQRINHKLPLDGQSELLPYDKRWEFPRDCLKIGKQLGAGCFGRVLQAEAKGIVPGEESKTETVAVKMVRSYADLGALASLVSELKILIHLGSHLNIVNLLGACTDVSTGDFLVIVEYCRFGNLLNHLLANRHCYVDQVDMNGDLLPIDVPQQNQSDCGGADYLYMGAPSSAPAFVPIPVKLERKKSRRENHTDYLVMLLNNRGSVSFNRSPPVEQEEEVDTVNNQPFSTRDLICWSFQIARGMDYLSGRNVVHGDLAARNILLAIDGVVKIADFGLSRKIYQDSNYKKKGDAMLPVKWMALESLVDRIFSSHSDVWAFGVTMWEMFSLGKVPYPDMEDIGSLIQHLENGGRMEIPRQSPNTVAQIISRCWKADPNVRPTFGQLEQMLGDWVEAAVRIKYVDMNEPYNRRNAERIGSLADDFSSEDPASNQQQTRGYVNVQEL